MWQEAPIHSPPSLSSAAACALSRSLSAKHWYMPLCALTTPCTLSTRSPPPTGTPSCSHLTRASPPSTEQLKVTELPELATCRKIVVLNNFELGELNNVMNCIISSPNCPVTVLKPKKLEKVYLV